MSSPNAEGFSRLLSNFFQPSGKKSYDQLHQLVQPLRKQLQEAKMRQYEADRAAHEIKAEEQEEEKQRLASLENERALELEVLKQQLAVFEKIFPFMIQDKQYSFPFEGKTMHICRTRDRILMMVSSDPDRKVPLNHWWASQDDISSSDVDNYQIVVFDFQGKRLNSVFKYSRAVLDDFVSYNQKYGWYAADDVVELSRLQDRGDVEEIRAAQQTVKDLTWPPQELIAEQEKFEGAKAALAERITKIEDLRDSASGMPLKVKNQQKWVFFGENWNVYVLDDINAATQFSAHNYPARNILAHIQWTGDLGINMIDVDKLKRDLAEGKITQQQANYSNDSLYGKSFVTEPLKVDYPILDQAINAFDEIIGYEFEVPEVVDAI
ncbi:MAG: hypothetical protein ACOZAN_02565 [Patescibacteria group bacterium]